MGKIQNLVAGLGNRVAGLENSNLGQAAASGIVVEDWLVIPFQFGLLPAAIAGPPVRPSVALLTTMVSGDGPFDLVEITHIATDDNFTILIREGESVGRQLSMDQLVIPPPLPPAPLIPAGIQAANTSGTAQRPYILKSRRRYRAMVGITIEIENFSLAPNDITVVLHGLKVFTR
jgi:hypothetical protein